MRPRRSLIVVLAAAAVVAGGAAVATIELVGDQLRARGASLCIDSLEPDGTTHGCGSNAVLGGGAIDATSSVRDGEAKLVRVRDRVLLRRLEVSGPFGRNLAELPPGGRAVQVEARDARGRRLGVAGFEQFGQPEGEGRPCLGLPTVERVRVLGTRRVGRAGSVEATRGA